MNINAPASFEAQDAMPIADRLAAQQTRPSFLARHRWFLLFVVVPTLIAAIYNGFIASDVYISESRFVVKAADDKGARVSSLASLIQTTGLSSGQEQTNEILAYAHSRDALSELEKSIDVREKFSRPDVDFFSRFPGPLADHTFEELYKFYQSKVEIGLDTNTGTAIIKVKAFAPRDAYHINLRLLQVSEQLVNRLNDRARQRGIGEAERQVELATERVREARKLVTEYRNSQEVIDPAKQVGGVLEVSNRLITERAALQAQLDLMLRTTPQHPTIPVVRDRINAITAQIATQDGRLVGSKQGIASKIGDYENLLFEQEFATSALNAANAALVQARAEAQRQQFYLERVVNPNVPDAPLLPNRLLNTIIVAAAALCLYFIGWMLVVGILEHAPEN
jgi:capsular polysaccharide transport system permease protein